MKKKLLRRFTLIGITIALLIGGTGGVIYLISELLYGDYPNIAYVLGQSGLGVVFIVCLVNLIVGLVESYQEDW